jgi:hypothetical protein
VVFHGAFLLSNPQLTTFFTTSFFRKQTNTSKIKPTQHKTKQSKTSEAIKHKHLKVKYGSREEKGERFEKGTCICTCICTCTCTTANIGANINFENRVRLTVSAINPNRSRMDRICSGDIYDAIVRFLLVIAVVLLIVVGPVSSILFAAMLSRKRRVHFNDVISIVGANTPWARLY